MTKAYYFGRMNVYTPNNRYWRPVWRRYLDGETVRGRCEGGCGKRTSQTLHSPSPRCKSRAVSGRPGDVMSGCWPVKLHGMQTLALIFTVASPFTPPLDRVYTALEPARRPHTVRLPFVYRVDTGLQNRSHTVQNVAYAQHFGPGRKMANVRWRSLAFDERPSNAFSVHLPCSNV